MKKMFAVMAVVAIGVAFYSGYWPERTSRRLSEAALSTADFTLAAGDISGRKVTIAAKSGLAVIAAGTADHVALLDPSGPRRGHGNTRWGLVENAAVEPDL